MKEAARRGIVARLYKRSGTRAGAALVPLRFCFLLSTSLEVEPHGRLHASVTRRGVAAAAEAARGEERLPEARRAKVPHGVREVRVVEKVYEEEREVERVLLPL